MTQLDEFKISSDKRLLQISKNISLAQMMPTELAQFRQTGRIEFKTLMKWFDWDFPGHYMRLIKSVKVTVLALASPTDGIHATLSNYGASYVVIEENKVYSLKSAMRTFTESIALDSPYNDTGLFVLDYNDPMFLPFEGLGVQTGWLFELPRATNRFNFDTIVDIIFTIDYTAKYDPTYKNQVIGELGNELSTDLVLNLRTNYPDEWYFLKNPEKPEEDQEITIELSRYSLPPSLENINVEHLTVIMTLQDADTDIPSNILNGIRLTKNEINEFIFALECQAQSKNVPERSAKMHHFVTLI